MTAPPAGSARPVVVLVESNTTGTGRQFAAAAGSRGLHPLVLCADPGRYPWLATDGIDSVQVDTSEAAAVTLAAGRFAAGAGADLAGVVSSSEYFVGVAARVAARLGLPGPEPGAVERCRDKRRQQAALAAAGVTVPAFAAASSARAAVEGAESIGFPVVVKPADGSGSRGVRWCADAGEVAEHAARLLEDGRDERGRPSLPGVLVEEHVLGREVSVETFGTGVVGVTAKHLGPLPAFVETGHDFPACDGPPSCECRGGDDTSSEGGGAAALAVDALRALGLGFGPAHTEIRLSRRGPVVVEVNPRLAGGRIPTLVRLATGIDLIGATLDAVVGAPRPLPAAGPGHASIRFLVMSEHGRVRSTGGVAAAAAVAGVVDVAVAARPGQWVGGTGSFLDRVGHVITAAPTAAGARAAATEALACLSVTIEAVDDTDGNVRSRSLAGGAIAPGRG